MKNIFTLVVGLFFYINANSQPEIKDFYVTVLAGGTYSKISGIESTILSEPFFIRYDANDKIFRKGIVAGIAVDYRFQSKDAQYDATNLGVGFETSYAMQRGEFIMNNYVNDFNYRMQFNYDYINLTLLSKCFLARDAKKTFRFGSYICAGVQFGIPLTPGNIKYKAWGAGNIPAFGSEAEQEQQLRNVLKGKGNIGGTAGIGFKFLKYFTLDARAFVGLTDVIETLVNSYNFIEYKKNRNTVFQATLHYTINND